MDNRRQQNIRQRAITKRAIAQILNKHLPALLDFYARGDVKFKQDGTVYAKFLDEYKSLMEPIRTALGKGTCYVRTSAYSDRMYLHLSKSYQVDHDHPLGYHVEYVKFTVYVGKLGQSDTVPEFTRIKVDTPQTHINKTLKAGKIKERINELQRELSRLKLDVGGEVNL